ncbi:DUF6398 domain-containing protein [Crocosphaera watsonii]|uniref:DUF6398 domain-containing protein n=3 Tax=Crocosphaera watsonii TaxID=263511 RepID=T2JVH5_CROWT|nr:DUF6398 domain-containing protein [Crocosphaera watsonii]EHJ09607.1 hypothetical protein CWATWH0003_5614 [Crocosphaera watsonii WH 0003]CCQ55673.1 hypothetical protein CWATWH0005_4046 [Crocosphaera watsonii WH 0005]CCQ69220.1 hypothetical protein CWATWH0402_2488 [Crocosphaera watsonii WH 0402]
MTFNLTQLDSLTYDEAEPLLESYIEGAIETFAHSPEGQAYLETHETLGSWIGSFLELAYLYEEYTLSMMAFTHVQEIMEGLLPRKITLLNPSEADDAIAELLCFWQFLKRQYKLKKADSIIQYLSDIESTFPSLMNDPHSGGFLKNLLLQGHELGFDMTSQKGLEAFQEHFNAQQQSSENDSEIPSKPQTIPQKSESVPKTMQAKYDQIIALTNEFASQHLNDEYAQLIRAATAALARKRPSPLSRGQAKSWACGITHALGMVNFLYDSSFSPHISAGDLYDAFGVSSSTGQSKSKQTRDLLKMSQLDPDWTLPSLIDRNPMVWRISVDGLMVDARTMPRPIQEVAYAKGLIPYLP